jgi:hypothetical protein
MAAWRFLKQIVSENSGSIAYQMIQPERDWRLEKALDGKENRICSLVSVNHFDYPFDSSVQNWSSSVKQHVSAFS